MVNYIWVLLEENLSTGIATRKDSIQTLQLPTIARILKFCAAIINSEV